LLLTLVSAPAAAGVESFADWLCAFSDHNGVHVAQAVA
jgi:hypothetical protein